MHFRVKSETCQVYTATEYCFRNWLALALKFFTFHLLLSHFVKAVVTLQNSLHSTDAIPHSTEQPPQYWRYASTVLILSPHVLMLSPTVLMISLHSTDVIPHMFWCYPPQYCSYPSAILNSLHSTDAIPHMYCSYPSMVLNSFHSPDAIPHSTEQLPQYWTDVIRGEHTRNWEGCEHAKILTKSISSD